MQLEESVAARSARRLTVVGLGVLMAIALVGVGAFMWLRASQAVNEAAFCNPLFAEAAQQNPNDWEQRIHPTVKPMLDWQRIVDCHAVIIGWGDPENEVVINVGRWDGTDLFALGLPRVYNGKPVVIRDVGDFPTP